MTEAIQIQTPGGDYPVHVGSGLGDALGEAIRGYREIALVTDTRVAELDYFQPWREMMSSDRERYLECVVPAGEEAKAISCYASCLSALAEQAVSRSGLLVALGGGVVGDLGGFVAASYLRGIDFIQVPTTLLAMVDSSVGGKTGINLPEGKNLVGAFYQPRAVLADLAALDSLPEREFAAGMAEVIKYGLIRDPELFKQCGRPASIDREAMIRRCIQIKADVVAEDEKETSGLRAILNFGHTLAHAIEQASGYGQLLHGEAVAIGMVGATWLSTRLCGLPSEWVERVETVLEANQLPTRLEGLTYGDLEAAISRDKKAVSGKVKWVLLEDIAVIKRTDEVPPELVRDAVKYLSGS
jgi:3-dehydroquinate synthase